VIWKTAIVGNTVYAVGSFTKARPAGKPAGDPSEVARSNILSFSLTTGALLPFAPVLNAQALAIKASPDGSEIYVGGDFTTVGNTAREHIAAFTTANGALDPNFAPSISAQVRAVDVTANMVYAGGVFGKVGGNSRPRLAQLRRSNGDLTHWRATADDDQVEALVAAPDDSRIIIGGRFQSLDGKRHVGIGAVNGTTGATVPWSSNPIPGKVGTNRSWVTSLILVGSTVYGGADGEGSHWYDGRFAASFATGNLIWLDNCYGATYGVATQGQALYFVGHAHDCSSLNAFPDTSPATYHRGLAETTYATGTDQTPPGTNSAYSHQPIPSLLHWYPLINAGTFTGQNQGAWTVSSTSKYVVLGGEFTQINGAAQQGLVRFETKDLAPNKEGPQQQYNANLIPVPTSIQSGSVRVTWKGLWDKDNAGLTYDLFRDADTTPIYTTKVNSEFWNIPTIQFTDKGLDTGSQHTYKVRVTDPYGNTVTSPKSAAVTVSASSPYTDGVVAAGPSNYWRLGEATGNATSYDYAGVNDLTVGSGVTRGAAGAISGDTDAASTFDGTANGTAGTATAVSAPTTFSTEAWIKTTSTEGGKVIGFGSAKTGSSGSNDRSVYLDSAGHVYFGVYNGGHDTVHSAASYNDGQWHHLVATLGSTGMNLYVDGVVVGHSAATTTAKVYSGYWRLGGDNLGGWPARPSSDYLAGTIDDVAVYPKALTISQVVGNYVNSGRTKPTVADTYGKSVTANAPSLFWRLDDTAGPTAADATANNRNGTFTGGVTYGQPAAVPGLGSSVALNGTSGGAYDNTKVTGPTAYSAEVWFKAITTRGGSILDFGSSKTGSSPSHDRQVVMLKTGQLQFGVYTTKQNVLLTSNKYNDDKWHYLVTTLGSGGMRIYVDNKLVGSNTVTTAKAYSGYWRLGGDGTWGGTASNYFHGAVDEVAIYPAQLTAAQIKAHWLAGGGK
jgi:hypothetical protein